MAPAGPKVIGNNTKWAFGLAVACFLIGAGLLSKINALMGLLAPVAAGAGVYMARKDMQDFATGRNPQLNDGVAKGAFWLNVVLLAFDIVMILYGVSKATG